MTPETSMSDQHTWCGFIYVLFPQLFFHGVEIPRNGIVAETMKVLNKFVSCFGLTVPLLENRACKVTHQDFSVDLSLNLASAPACPFCLSFKCIV